MHRSKTFVYAHGENAYLECILSRVNIAQQETDALPLVKGCHILILSLKSILVFAEVNKQHGLSKSTDI